MSNSLPSLAIGMVSIALLTVGATVFSRVILTLRKEGGKVRSAGFQIPEALVAFILGSYFGGVIAMSALPQKNGSPASTAQQMDPGSVVWKELVPTAIFFAILVSGIALYLKFARGMNLRETFGIDRLPPLKILGWAIGLLACALPLTAVASLITLQTLPREDLEQQPLVLVFRDVSLHGNYSIVAAIFIAAVVVAPVCEEFIFRGFFYGVGKRFLGAAPAMVLTAMLFAAFHLNLASFASLFVLAVCLTLAYERTGSLLVSMCMHAAFNFVNLAIMFGQTQGWFQAQ